MVWKQFLLKFTFDPDREVGGVCIFENGKLGICRKVNIMGKLKFIAHSVFAWRRRWRGENVSRCCCLFLLK